MTDETTDDSKPSPTVAKRLDGWTFERFDASPEGLHSLGVPDGTDAVIRHCVPTSSAIVLGSTQSQEVVDHEVAARLGCEVIRRRSGGGAVLVQPQDTCWVDVFVPAGHRLWHRDVGVATHWVGGAWSRALERLGTDCHVHTGAMMRAVLAGEVCFAGLGPGEVCVGAAKVVGISQRRTRAGALFQCSVYRQFRIDRLADLLRLSLDDVEALRRQVFEVRRLSDDAVVEALTFEITRS